MQSDVCKDEDVEKILEDEKKENDTTTVEPTVIEVPIPEGEKDSSVEEVDNEELYKLKPNLSPDSEEIVKIDNERKEYLIARAKEAEIDFSTIELGENGYTPKITDEMVEVFASYSNGLFDKDFMNVYIDQAVSIIDQYLDFKKMVDGGMIDEDDLEYYDGLSKSAEEGRLILALVQNEYNKIKKEFDENKVFELQSKAMTISLLRDFFVEKFRLTDTLYYDKVDDVSKFDKSEFLDNEIAEKMFVSPIFRQYIYRMRVMSESRHDYGPLTPKFFETEFDELIYGINAYIDTLEDQKDIDIKEIIYKDFNNLNYVKAVLTMMFIVNNDPFINLEKNKELVERLKAKLDPNNCFTTSEDNPFKHLYDMFNNDLINVLSNADKLKTLCERMKLIVTSDKVYKKLKVDIELPYVDFIKTISENIPDIKGTKIVKWGKYYALLKKFELYHSVKLACETYSNESIPNETKRSVLIEMITSFLVEYMGIVIGKMTSDIKNNVTDNVYSKEIRPTMFAMIMNSILLQHELGFKSEFKNDETSGDGLYSLAEKVFGNQYKYMIVDKDKDYLLKKVDLIKTRREYYSSVEELIMLFRLGLNNI